MNEASRKARIILTTITVVYPGFHYASHIKETWPVCSHFRKASARREVCFCFYDLEHNSAS